MNILDKRIVYFITVVEEGSFSAAARKLILTQPALSQQITLLEDELGIKIFDRSGYKPVLTDEGDRFYQGCLRLREEAESLLTELIASQSYTISMAFTGSSENRELLDILGKYKQNHPGVVFSFKKGDFAMGADLLRRGEVDFALGIESEYVGDSEMEYVVLFDFKMSVICSFSHRFAEKKFVTVDDIRNEKFIALSKKFGKRSYQDFLSAFKKDGIVPKIKKETDSFDELIFNVSLDEGIGVVAAAVVPANQVKAVPLKGSHHGSKCVLAYRKRELPPYEKEFVEAMVKYFKKRKQ